VEGFDEEGGVSEMFGGGSVVVTLSVGGGSGSSALLDVSGRSFFELLLC
jgi:hypothetical protein